MTSEFDIIREHLSTNHRDLLLFEMILHTRLPVKNLLKLKIKDVKKLNIGDPLPIFDKEKIAAPSPVVTPEIYTALRSLLLEVSNKDDDYLFKSRKGNRPLSVPSVSRIIRGWKEKTGFTHYKGLPSLRQAQQETLKKTNSPQKNSLPSPGAILPRVQPRTAQEIVYTELEEAIVSGRIPPGQKLVTEEISRMMDVSRIPVREAMGRLEAKGFISTRPKWGSVVNTLSRANLKEIFEIRIQLEPQAGTKAALKVSDAFILRLEEAQAAYARARKGAETIKLLRTNRRFHFLIYEQANTPILLDIIKQLWDKVSPYYHLMFKQSLDRSPTVGVNYHESIVNCLKKKDVKGVEKWLKSDLKDSTEYILKLFDSSSFQK
nr:FCD domain-containing protein [uncultured Desulfobacter sp.]